MGGEPVYLNIYDLSDQNNWTYWCGVGIFHSGLEVYGVEYAYGGADGLLDRQGILPSRTVKQTCTYALDLPLNCAKCCRS